MLAEHYQRLVKKAIFSVAIEQVENSMKLLTIDFSKFLFLNSSIARGNFQQNYFLKFYFDYYQNNVIIILR